MSRRDAQREATRDRIAAAAAALLAEGGGTPPTTVAVQRAAGVSRGALLHHFPSRAALLAGAVAALRAGNARAVECALSDAGPEDSVDRAVRALAAAAVRPEMSAEFGLWSSARVDADLRAALRSEERAARDSLESVIRRAFGPTLAEHPMFERVAALTVQFLRGLSVTHALREPDDQTAALLRDWATVARALLQPSVQSGERLSLEP